MFSFFSNDKKEELPTLADRVNGVPASKPAVPAPAASAEDDIRVRYLSQTELDSSHLKELSGVAQGPALVLGFISPDLSMDSVAQAIKRGLPGSTKLILMTTAGELCRPAGSSSFYCPDPEGRGKVLLQSYSHRMIEDSYVMSIPLHNEDLKNGEVSMSVADRVELIQKEIDRHNVPFRISVNHSFALIYADGVSGCETFVLQALYNSGRFPALLL